MIVPTASGDTFYGIAKRFAEASSALGEAPATVLRRSRAAPTP